MVNRESHKSLNPQHPATANRRFNQLWSRYETLQATISLHENDDEFGYTGFEIRDHAGNRLRRTSMTNAWMLATYRKTSDAPFVVPTDHLLFPLGDVVAATLTSNFDKYSRARLAPPPHGWRPRGTATASLVSAAKFVLWKSAVKIWLRLKPMLPRR